MIRFALILLMSLAVSSQAVAAVKWNNSVDDGKAVNYRKGGGLPTEIPASARPNDATISLYEEGRVKFFNRLKSGRNIHTIKP